jgi:hypothetical protein
LVPTLRVSVTLAWPTKACGRTVTGLRRLTPSSPAKVTAPNTQVPIVADVRVTWTVTVWVAPGVDRKARRRDHGREPSDGG